MQAFELKECLHFYRKVRKHGQKTVMASLVGLKGSSYRQPGVRMLIAQDNTMSGALSGGCVENEIVASAQSVFESGISKVISYNGQYRLGCEGLLFILIEPFELDKEDVNTLLIQLEARQNIHITSHYKESTTSIGNYYSVVNGTALHKEIQFNNITKVGEQPSIFKQSVLPDRQLLIIGGEHDAQKLCRQAAFLGWDVIMVTSPKSQKRRQDFPEAKTVLAATPEIFDTSVIDAYTSVVLMTHNYALDLQFLLKLKDLTISYIGILGSKKRKSSLEFALLDRAPELEVHFLDRLYSPAGLNIGAITPQEIAVSIIAEIMQITKKNEQSTKMELTSTTTTAIKRSLS